MRCTVLTLVTALTSAMGPTCGSSEPDRVTLGESFVLRIGESAQIEAEALWLEFEDVSGDSRCPKGAQCVWEGDATVRVSLRKAPEAKETRELHTSPKEQGAASYLDYELRLLRLDPHPVMGRTIPRGDYVASLVLTRGSSAAPDR